MRANTRRGRLALALVTAFWLVPGNPSAAEPREADARSHAVSLASEDGDAQRHRRRGRRRRGFSGGHAAPEIDPGLFAGGAALLVGGTLVLLGHRRQRRLSTSSR